MGRNDDGRRRVQAAETVDLLGQRHVVLARRADPDDALRAGVADDVGDGVGGVDDQVEEDLIQLARLADDQRQL